MTIDEQLRPEQIAAITAFVNIEAPPPDKPVALCIFGTNQAAPAVLAAERYHQGLAPLIIATGGVNRHNGIVEGREFHRLLHHEHCVPDEAIRYEDTSANTWQNVEFAMPHLREAIEAGLAITAVSKWYHRRAIHALRTLLPDVAGFYALTWEPIYGDGPITPGNWPAHPHGRRRVLREWHEVRTQVRDGSIAAAHLVDGAWGPGDTTS